MIADLGDDTQISFASGSVILKGVSGITTGGDMLFAVMDPVIVGTAADDDGVANPGLAGEIDDSTFDGLAGDDRLYGMGANDLI